LRRQRFGDDGDRLLLYDEARWRDDVELVDDTGRELAVDVLDDLRVKIETKVAADGIVGSLLLRRFDANRVGVGR
jgi:hypothetical protein